MNLYIDICNFKLIQTNVSFSIKMLREIFPPKDFLSIGVMLEEFYVNVARSQYENLDNLYIVLYLQLILINCHMEHKYAI